MLTVRIPPDLRERIDDVRGDVPRERWIRRALEAALTDETPRPSPAGREAEIEVATRPARPAATNRPGASRPSASPRTSTRKKAAPSGDGTPLPKIARKHWA